jgi:hypothetical protein
VIGFILIRFIALCFVWAPGTSMREEGQEETDAEERDEGIGVMREKEVRTHDEKEMGKGMRV